MKIIASIIALSAATLGGYQAWEYSCDGKKQGDGQGQCGRQDCPTKSPDQVEDEAAILDNAASNEVVIIGGYKTDSRDGGRPVALIAAALGVEDDVFRDAFKDVRPSRFGPPSPWQARENKTVLMNALEPYGVSNDRLDVVSNRYRYRPQDGELWSHKPAELVAVIEDGKVTGVEIQDPGYGYLSEPSVVIKGHESVKIKASIAFSTDMDKNGRVESVELLTDELSSDAGSE